MLDDAEKRRKAGRWIIGVFTCCVLIYLGLRHVSSIANALSFLVGLIEPLMIGGILALILNVPMRMFERLFRKKTSMKRGVRALSTALKTLYERYMSCQDTFERAGVVDCPGNSIFYGIF